MRQTSMNVALGILSSNSREAKTIFFSVKIKFSETDTEILHHISDPIIKIYRIINNRVYLLFNAVPFPGR